MKSKHKLAIVLKDLSGDQIRQIRVENKLKRRTLAAYLGIRRKDLKTWEAKGLGGTVVGIAADMLRLMHHHLFRVVPLETPIVDAPLMTGEVSALNASKHRKSASASTGVS